jgi:tripartite-type tricarboxylate transporter receptor subunit TctC
VAGAHRRALYAGRRCRHHGAPDRAQAAGGGTPSATIERLHGDVARILATDKIKARFADLGARPIGSTSAELAAFLRGGTEVVKVANIKIE